MTNEATTKKGAGGRPRKFAEPSRPITVTLPDRILNLLNLIDPDRAKAVTKAAERCVPSGQSESRLVEVVEVAPGIGLIVVGPSRRLKQIPWLRLAEIAPARFIITIVPGTSVDTLELTVVDLIEDLGSEEVHERLILEELLKWIRPLRRGQNITKAELLFVSTKPIRK